MKALTMMANAAYVYGLTIDDLRGESRAADVCEARQLAVYVIRRDAGLSFPALGRLFRRGHTTMIYSYRQAAADIKAGGRMAEKLAEYEKAVGK